MTGNGDCPTHETLVALLLGKLSPEQEGPVNDHVEMCAACAARVEQIEQEPDPLIDALRQPPTQRFVAAGNSTMPQTAPVVPPSPEAPFHLEGFQILQEVGRGGMGVVYRAYQHRLNRLVAIKMILAGQMAGSEDRVRFRLEGALLARLNHPNFVQVYEVGTVEVAPGAVQPYLVLEYVEGSSLKVALAGKPLPFREAAGLVLVLARAMEAAHAQGIIHRDLKPANVLVAASGTLKITDFGLAKEVGTDSSLTPTGLMVGTPNYMAPEQAQGDKALGPAIDVYALGAVLYEMLTGRPPFGGDRAVDVILRVLQEVPVPPHRLRPGLPRDLETICLKCLEKDPRARYAGAAELADDLEYWLQNRPIRARPVGLFIRDGGAIEVVDARTGTALGQGVDCLPPDVERPPDLFPQRQVVQSFLNPNEFFSWDLKRAAPSRPLLRLPGTIVDHPLTGDGRQLVHLFANHHVGWQDLASGLPWLPVAGLGRGAVRGIDQIFPGPYGHSCLVASRAGPSLKRFDFPRLLASRAPGGAGVAPARPVFGAAAFSPDRQRVLLGDTAHPWGQTYARLVATADNRPVGLPLTDCDNQATFSPSGRLVALGTWDNPKKGARLIVRVYDTRTGEPRSPEWVMKSYLHTLEFSADERLLAVGHVNGAAVCDVEKDGTARELEQPGPISRLRFSKSGRHLALASRSGWKNSKPGVQVWDVTTGKPAADRVALADAPLLLAAEDGDGFHTLELDRGRLRRWDFGSGVPVADLGVIANWPGDLRNSDGLTLDPARARLAVGTAHGAIYRWDLRTLRRLGPDADFKEPVRKLAYGPDGRWLGAVGDDGIVGLFDTQTGRRVGPLLTHGLSLLALAFSPDGQALLTATPDGQVHRWELGQPQELGVEEWRTWLEAATGLRLEGDALVSLSIADYRQRVERARGLPTPLTPPVVVPARWHAAEAFRAEQVGQFNSARWHLDRWIALEPTVWLPLARRARLTALEGDAQAATADLKRAAALAPAEVEHWQRHQAVLGKLLNRPLPAIACP